MRDTDHFRKMDCGSRIRELRLENNLTQEELANLIHTSHSNLAKIELGISRPSFDLLVEMRNFFHIPVDYILFGLDDLPSDLITSIHITIRNLKQMEQNLRHLNINE